MDSATNRDLGLLEGPLLIFGGPYGNLPATTALRTLAEQRGIPPEHIICIPQSRSRHTVSSGSAQ